MTFTREMLEQRYEDATGLNANQGQGRIDHLESWIREHNITDFEIFNDTEKIKKDYQMGINWSAGTQHEDTILLGYTSGNLYTYKNAIFAQEIQK